MGALIWPKAATRNKMKKAISKTLRGGDDNVLNHTHSFIKPGITTPREPTILSGFGEGQPEAMNSAPSAESLQAEPGDYRA